MIRGARPLMIVLGTTLVHGSLHAQDGQAPFQGAAATAPKIPSKIQSKARPKAQGFEFRKAEANNALAMRWTCVGCTDQRRPRPDAEDSSSRPGDSDEPVITDPAQAPVIE